MRRPAEKKDKSALRIALIYAVVSALWILFSDLLLVGISNPRLFATLSIAKGWLFVAVTAGLLYLLVQRTILRIWHTEARMSLIFDSVNDPIFLYYLVDGQPGTFIDANQAAIQQLGYSLDELKTMTPLDLIKPEFRDQTRDIMSQLRDSGRAIEETCAVTRDGCHLPVEASARTLRIGSMVMGVSVVRDITDRKRTERERREEAVASERDKRLFYRETILAVTGGKFELADPAEAEDWIRNPDIGIHVSSASDMADARHEILQYCARAGMAEVSLQEFELAVGESLGNAVKHSGEGWVYAGREANSVWVAVVDHGKGIDTFIIPSVALLTGFTTKASMGLGYTLILRACDHVRLATGPGGTTVVMQKLLRPASELDSRLSVFAGIE